LSSPFWTLHRVRSEMKSTRKPAVAGIFYPSSAETLEGQVRHFLGEARTAGGEGGTRPKALIVPHAGYAYSGAAAGSAFAHIANLRSSINRVVLIGPAHRVPLRGFAIPSARAFRTPLGEVHLDRKGVEALRALSTVEVMDAAHSDEHCLEVQLPFLQVLLGNFFIVPIVAGEASPEQTAEVLETVWGGPETLIVVSSDLSHYQDVDTARQMDRQTADAIEALRPEDLVVGGACGRVPIGGLLHAARERGLEVTTTALVNSGDVTGDRHQVVGYGAFVFRPGRQDR